LLHAIWQKREGILLIVQDDKNEKHANVELYKSKLLFLVQFSRRLFNSTTELVQNLSRLSSGQKEAVSMADKEGYD